MKTSAGCKLSISEVLVFVFIYFLYFKFLFFLPFLQSVFGFLFLFFLSLPFPLRLSSIQMGEKDWHGKKINKAP